MDRATSMFYGTIVKAVDCDRTTFKEKGLVCPIPGCGGGVYLVRGEKQVPHFRHFAGKGKPDCEARVLQIPESQWKKQRRQIEHQYLRDMQSRFWKIFTSYYRMNDFVIMQQQLKEHENEPPFSNWWPVWSTTLRKRQKLVLTFVGSLSEAMSLGKYTLKPEKKGDPQYKKDAANIIDRINLTTQRQSIEASVSFLLQQRNEELLKLLYFYTIFDWFGYSVRYPTEFPFPVTKDLVRLCYLWCLTDLVGLLGAIPWAEAADAIKDGEIPDSLRSNIRPRMQGVQALPYLGSDALSIFADAQANVSGPSPFGPPAAPPGVQPMHIYNWG